MQSLMMNFLVVSVKDDIMATVGLTNLLTSDVSINSGSKSKIANRLHVFVEPKKSSQILKFTNMRL